MVFNCDGKIVSAGNIRVQAETPTMEPVSMGVGIRIALKTIPPTKADAMVTDSWNNIFTAAPHNKNMTIRSKGERTLLRIG